jgi:hypothetical protein
MQIERKAKRKKKIWNFFEEHLSDSEMDKQISKKIALHEPF